MTKVLGLLGMPGSGKTTALETLEERTDYSFTGLKMKKIAAEEFKEMKSRGLESFPEDTAEKIREMGLIDQATPDGELGVEIADWVDTILKVDNTYFARKASQKITNMEESEVVVVDGIRSVPDANHVMGSSENDSHLVFLHTPFSTRLSRLKNRSRSGEENIDSEYLIERDEQELRWGVDEILSSYDKESTEYDQTYRVEFFYANHGNVEAFSREFNIFVDDLLDLY